MGRPEAVAAGPLGGTVAPPVPGESPAAAPSPPLPLLVRWRLAACLARCCAAAAGARPGAGAWAAARLTPAPPQRLPARFCWRP